VPPALIAAAIARLPHAHLPGPALHDDHVCAHVTCSVCGKPGLNVNGAWQDPT
jgi:hypothetical protein